MVEFYVDHIHRYNGMPRIKYLLKTIKRSKFISTSNRKLIAVVTGANGAIGTEITRLLLQNNFRVFVANTVLHFLTFHILVLHF